MELICKVSGGVLVLLNEENRNRVVFQIKGYRSKPQIIAHLHKETILKEGVIALQDVKDQDYWGAAKKIIQRVLETRKGELDKTKLEESIDNWIHNIVIDYWTNV